MGQAPASGAASLRSFNRNFQGRSGTADASVYLASAEVCAASAIAGVHHRPARPWARRPVVTVPARYLVNDNMIVAAAGRWPRGGGRARPQHQAAAHARRAGGRVAGRAAAGHRRQHHHRPHHARRRQVLPFRSNIPAMSELCLRARRPDLPPARAQGRRAVHDRRRELWPGLQPRARRAGAHVSGRQGGASSRALRASTRPTWSTWASCR